MFKTIDIIGIPSGLGNASAVGARDGPEVLRKRLPDALARVGYTCRYFDMKDDSGHPEFFDATAPSFGKIEYQRKIRAIGTYAAQAVFRSRHLGHLTLVLGGDNSFSAFTLPAAARVIRDEEDGSMGLLYIDAHLDMHTEKTSETHHAHGMALAAAMGYGRLAHYQSSFYPIIRGKRRIRWKEHRAKATPALYPWNIIHIGAGTLHVEPAEHEFARQHRVPVFDLQFLRGSNGWNDLFEAVARLVERTARIAVMIDVDVFHQYIAPGVAYRNPIGLTPAEWPQLFDHIRELAGEKLVHIEVMEYNPSRDVSSPDGTLRTASLITEVLLRLLTP